MSAGAPGAADTASNNVSRPLSSAGATLNLLLLPKKMIKTIKNMN
jgi:hypothetical protein